MPLIDPVTMSSMSSASQSRSSRSSMPIELLPTAIAGSNYVSPVLLLSTLYLRFPALVADPVATLLQALIPVTACQTAYCLYCLPVAGTNSRVAKRTQKSKGGTVKKLTDALSPAAKASVSTFQSVYKPYLANADQNLYKACHPLPPSNHPLHPLLPNHPNPPWRPPHLSPPANTPLIRSPRTSRSVPSHICTRH